MRGSSFAELESRLPGNDRFPERTAAMSRHHAKSPICRTAKRNKLDNSGVWFRAARFRKARPSFAALTDHAMIAAIAEVLPAPESLWTPESPFADLRAGDEKRYDRNRFWTIEIRMI